ncbi:MAG: hypothetical protein PGN34_10755 [Methylobacterium frigidaeris]
MRIRLHHELVAVVALLGLVAAGIALVAAIQSAAGSITGTNDAATAGADA